MADDNFDEPVYEVVLPSSGQVARCSRCRMLLLKSDSTAHTAWHRSLQLIANSLAAVSQLLAPALPPNTFLTGGSGSVTTPGGGGGHGGSTVTQAGIAFGGEGGRAGGAGGGSGASAFGDRIAVGRGGVGNDPKIPTCPICGARGGGGHGGGCRNFGKSPSDWEDA